MTLDDLFEKRRLERVPPDGDGAAARLEVARRHLKTAATVTEDDSDAAYAVLYDAARKAVTAHMAARGIRPRNAPGAHAAIAEYAESELGTAAENLDRMRRFRNQVEYGVTYVSVLQARADLKHAREIVAAVSRDLSR